jgi:hypothetical protein
MPNLCAKLHAYIRTLPVHSFPYDEHTIPKNGIYILFERGEGGHGGSRVVRVGTHTGKDQLPSRLRQHFLVPNKDRSIFRKNIGRCFLHKARDPYLSVWDMDMTTRSARTLHGKTIDARKQTDVEETISGYMRHNFSFVVIRVDEKEERLALESKIISTVSLCGECGPSKEWLGNYSTKEKIRKSGLWLVNELYKEPLSEADLAYMRKIST